MAIARGAVRVVSLSLLAALALPGCPYINNDTYTEYKNKLDQDGDGSSFGGGGGMPRDCDDLDGTRSPTLAEIPYNGIDDDCDDLDNVDADNDGYPQMSKDEWDELGGDPIWWPTDVSTDAFKVDCDDEDPNVHPDAPDQYYDGVDADCKGDNDYDQDLDGYVPDEYATESGLPGGDCNDQDNQINPGVPATSDKWYDGEDQNCDCVNDYDQDGDGYMNVGVTQAQYDAMVAAYAGFCTYDAPQFDDCQDEEAPTGFLPEEIHPGAIDTWYDGADSDCDGRNDFDQDEDGYYPTEFATEYGDFVAWWGYADLTGDNDCDDLDAAVHPGTLEAIADVVDQDCDGGADTTAWAFGGVLWDDPTEVVIDATDYNYLLATAANGLSTSSTYKWPAIALWFELDSGYQAEYTNQLVWHNPVASSAGEIGDGLDLYADGASFYAAISYSRSVGGIPYTYLALRKADWDDTGDGSFDLKSLKVSAIRDATDYFHDVDIKKADDGWVWAIGCGATYSATLACTMNGTDWCETGYNVPMSMTGSGAACFLDEPASSTPTVATATLCDGTSACTTSDVDRSTKLITTSATQPYATKAWDVVNDKLEWRVTVTAGALAIDDGTASYGVLGTYTVIDASADTAPNGDVYVAAVVEDESGDGEPDVVLAYGDPAGTMTEVVMPLTDGTDTWAPHSADVYADDNRVFIATSGTLPGGASSGTNDDAVAWIFFQAPPP